MKRSGLFFVKVFALYLKIVSTSSVTLQANTPQIINIKAKETIALNLDNIPSTTAYIICQAHAQVSQLELSTSAGYYYNSTAKGRDIGVVSLINGTYSVTWYLRLSNGSTDARVMVHTTLLTAKDPLPGGCNEEFNLENDPNIHVTQMHTSAIVRFQWSNLGYQPGKGIPASCEKNGNLLTYQSYVRFIQSAEFGEDTYFDTLKETLMARDIVKHGTWLQDLQSQKDKKSMLTISSYSGQGVIYTVVVVETNTSTGEVTQAAYIPVVEYDCDISKGCSNTEIAAIIFVTVGMFVGLLLCFFGHRFFKTENFIFGFLIFSLVMYQILALKTNVSLVGILVLTGVLGCVGGLLLLGLWWRLGLPVLNVLFIGLVLGYLFSSVLFYTPFANFSYWDTPFNYGVTFTCGVLILPVILLCFTRVLNIVSCAVVGAYGFILAIDVYVGSGMKYIVINSLRHGTDVEYVKVLITGPFTTKEIILSVLWALLAISGTTFQYIRERERPPFPPCPRREGDGFDHLRHLLSRNEQQISNDNDPVYRVVHPTISWGHNSSVPHTRGHNSSTGREDNSREPLLGENRGKVYGAIGKSENSGEDSEEESRPGLV